MGAVRDRNPEKGQSSTRATAYLFISAEEPLESASKQKTAIHPYAKTQKLHTSLIFSDRHRTKQC
jgi:hypothetical protein